MSYQSEAELENNLVKQLQGLDYSRVMLKTEAAVLTNLKSQLELFNTSVFSEKEFGNIMNHLAKENVYIKGDVTRRVF